MRTKPAIYGFSILLLVSLCLPLFPPSRAVAQLDQKEKAEKELERKQDLERKTLALLDEIAAGAWGLKLAENRSYVLASVAELLWERDDKRARNMYWEALNSLNLTPAPPTANQKGKSATNDKIASQYFEIYMPRQEFLRRVARRDPQLALDMLRATRQPPLELKNVQHLLPDESDLEQQIAGEAAARDPQRAMQIARESLARGLTVQLLNLLSRLVQQDANLGAEFAGDLIGKLRTENFDTSMHAPVIAVSLLEASRTRPNVLLAEPQGTTKYRRLKLNDEQKRDLVDLMLNAALSATSKGGYASYLTEMMPEIEQFAPGKVALVQSRLAESNRALGAEQKEWNTYNSLARSGNAEEMIRAAATVSESSRDTFYREAVLIAVMGGRADSLREFINSEVTDKSRRNSLIDSLDTEQIGYAASRGQTEELKKLLGQIRLKEQRARAMAEMAILLEKKGQHREALELLDEAQALIKIDLKSQTQSDALLSLVLGYALVSPAKAFSIIEPLIDRANDEVSKLLLLDKVIKSGFVKKNEIIMNTPGLPLDFAMFKYGLGVSALASADFNRTKAAADRFQRLELRIMARLMLAQALLRSQEEGAKNTEQ